MEDFSARISERLRELRKARGITQKAVFTAIGVPESQYQRYERGTHVPRLEHLASLADFFGVSIDYLVGRSDDPKGGVP